MKGPSIVRVLRQSLRQFAIAWLVIQVVSLSALAGFDCCASHRAAKQQAKAAQAAAEPTLCPMHAAARNTDRAPEKCVMRGTCNGPMAALFVLFTNNGIPSESPVTTPALDLTTAFTLSDDTFVVHFESPEPQPPRA